ncbi:serine/threonine-protein kinase pim-2-like [Acipenser oxyrinchus oxyrinchus]|uniref:non-specific serine/threonine protein kinase n=1 Tax=Acipenser oxyrinchus oxyrinchus TaxID=40147 RepID=A0AAD8FSI3_ACIOX|nr:serine/threonine-protein kinase pim-2-like [Acipenser oxyrinchus oxyrinchus]
MIKQGIDTEVVETRMELREFNGRRRFYLSRMNKWKSKMLREKQQQEKSKGREETEVEGSACSKYEGLVRPGRSQIFRVPQERKERKRKVMFSKSIKSTNEETKKKRKMVSTTLPARAPAKRKGDPLKQGPSRKWGWVEEPEKSIPHRNGDSRPRPSNLGLTGSFLVLRSRQIFREPTVPLRSSPSSKNDQDNNTADFNHTAFPTSHCKLSAQGSRCRASRGEKEPFNNLYSMGSILGTGGYGWVLEGHRKSDGLPVAIKLIPREMANNWVEIPQEKGRLPLEVALLKLVGRAPAHPGVIELLEWFEQPDAILLVLERPHPCSDLFDFAHSQGGLLKEHTARNLMHQLVAALEHCHRRGVLHRDVKPENILVKTDTESLKLIDFGCGDLIQDSVYTEFAGTPQYAPPEWVLQQQYHALPATAWSLGVLLFDLVCGHLPFRKDKDIIRGVLNFNKGVSKECRNLIRRCLSHCPESRPSLEEILLHPWMK